MGLKPAFSLKKPILSQPGETKSSLKAPKISLKPLSAGKSGFPKLSGLGTKSGLKPLTGLPKIKMSAAPKASSVNPPGGLKPIKTRVLDSGNNPLLNKFLSKKPGKADEVRVKDRQEAPAEERAIPASPLAEKPQAADQLEEAVVLGPKSGRGEEKPAAASINKSLSYQEHQELLREQNLLPALRQPLSGYLKGCFLSVVEEMNQIRDSMNSLENKLSYIEKDGFKSEQTLLLSSSWPAKEEKNSPEQESWRPISGSLVPEGLSKPTVPGRQDWQNTSLPPHQDGTWKETIVSLKAMASSEDALKYSQRKVLEKDSGLSPIKEMVMLTKLPARQADASDPSVKSRQTPFSQVEDQLRRIHTLINAHEQDNLEYEIISPEVEETLSFTSESFSEESPLEDGREYEDGLEYSQRLLYQQLLKDLFSSLEEVQVAAAESLSRYPFDRTAGVLMKAWRKTPFKGVRSEIAKSLSVLRDAAAVTLFQKYLTHDNRAYRMSALEGLYRMGTEKAVGGVMAALRSSDYQMRRRAATYVGWLKVPTALEELHPLLKDPNEFVRKVTLSVIGNLETPARIPLLIECLHDASLKIRQTACQKLREATGERLDFNPGASKENRVAAIKKWKEWYKRKDLKKDEKPE